MRLCNSSQAEQKTARVSTKVSFLFHSVAVSMNLMLANTESEQNHFALYFLLHPAPGQESVMKIKPVLYRHHDGHCHVCVCRRFIMVMCWCKDSTIAVKYSESLGTDDLHFAANFVEEFPSAGDYSYSLW